MYMRHINIIIILFTGILSVYGQLSVDNKLFLADSIVTRSSGNSNLINLPQMIPPSPASQPFQKFAGYTPNLATGAVNVEIPLYTLTVGNFSLPLSLNYHSNGIKVYDLPFPLGYGWVLFPGLRVSRTIMGQPDELFDNKINPYGDNNCRILQESLLEYANDSKYDFFSVSLPNRSVNFFIKKVNNVWEIMQVKSSLKIEIIQDQNRRINKFEIIDEDGIKYVFGDENYYLFSNYIEYSNNGYPTSWMLRNIVLPDNRNINFIWENANYIPVRRTNHALRVVDDIMTNLGNVNDCPSPLLGPFYTFIDYMDEWGDVVRYKQLKTITFPQGQIVFNYSPVSNKGYLQEINVFAGASTSINVKNITFNVSNESLLSSLSVSGEGTYQFFYNPLRFDNMSFQDYWGYYRGYTQIPMIPLVEMNICTNMYPNQTMVFGVADRSPFEFYMKANILTKIIYPT